MIMYLSNSRKIQGNMTVHVHKGAFTFLSRPNSLLAFKVLRSPDVGGDANSNTVSHLWLLGQMLQIKL